MTILMWHTASVVAEKEKRKRWTDFELQRRALPAEKFEQYIQGLYEA